MLIKKFDPGKLRDQLQKKAIETRRPLRCMFELTYQCNFQCRMCYIRMNDAQACAYGRLRTVDEWLDMARQVREAGVLFLDLTGGECTTYPGFDRLYPALCEMGFIVSLMSNAGSYTPALLELFAQYPPHAVAITLYGGSSETYGAVTGDPGGFERVLANIRALRAMQIPVSLNFTMTQQNIRDYPKIVEICRSFGLTYTFTDDLTPHNRDASFTDVAACRLSPAQRVCINRNSPYEVEKALAEAELLERELENFTLPQVTEPGEARPLNACIGSYSSAAIYWNGDMNTCISLAGGACYKPFEVGFEAAWAQMQADHQKRFTFPAKCLDCEVRQYCHHNCAARNLEATGDPQEPDPLSCQYAWLMKRYLDQKREIK